MTWWIASLVALLFLQTPFAPLCHAMLVNVTVDDTYPDPRTGAVWNYVPPDDWNVGQNCSGCYAQLDKTLVMNGSWHDSTFGGSPAYAKLDFTGSALYVYGVISNFPNSTMGSSTVHYYYLDGELVGTRLMEPSGQPTFTYNFLLYSNSSIPNGTHEFTLQNGSPSDPEQSLVLLDYAIYTTDVEPDGSMPSSTSMTPSSSTASPAASSNGGGSTSSHSHTQTIAIAVAVPLAVLAIVIAALTVFWCRRHRTQREGGQYDSPDLAAELTYPPWEKPAPSAARGIAKGAQGEVHQALPATTEAIAVVPALSSAMSDTSDMPLASSSALSSRAEKQGYGPSKGGDTFVVQNGEHVMEYRPGSHLVGSSADGPPAYEQ